MQKRLVYIASVILLVCISGCDLLGSNFIDPTPDPEPEPETDNPQQGLDGLLAGARASTEPAVVLHASTPNQYETAVAGRVRTDQATLAQANHLFRLASVSKTWVAVAVLQLVEDGDVKLDEPISTYLAADVANRIANAKRATVRQVLGMRSGVPEYLENAFYDAVLDNPTRSWTPRQALAFAENRPAAFAPDARFDYNNTNYLLLQLLLEHVTKKPIAPSAA
ncbi:MAG: hypothetical protein RhofKO_18170 [Rhodothermales bacterium]